MVSSFILKVLMIEDNPADVKIFRQMLERIGFKNEVSEVSSGEAAIQWLETNPSNLPQLIVLDLELPGIHGLEVLKKLKSHRDWEPIPVIVNTTSMNHEDISRTYRFGATFFMQKLYDIKLLEEVIQHLKVTGRIKPA